MWRPHRRFHLIASAALIASSFAQGPAAHLLNSAIGGVLVGDDGRPLNGTIFVRQVNLKPGKPGTRPTEWTVATKEDGTFYLDRLEFGNYAICAKVAGSDWLGSCEWGGTPLVWPVSSVPPTLRDQPKPPARTVTLRKGSPVTIEIDDPTSLLGARSEKVAVSVVGDISRWVPFTARVGSKSTFSLVVPVDVPLHLRVSSVSANFVDERGSLIGGGGLQFIVSKSAATSIRLMATSGAPR
jgi:hypothetical protein